MKKTCFVLLALIAILFIMLGNVYAIDLNLINSVRENEINSADNLLLENTLDYTNNADDELALENEDVLLDNQIIDDGESNPTTNVSNVTNTTDGTLTIGNIINILLIVVGFLLILLGIAIMIRMNR